MITIPTNDLDIPPGTPQISLGSIDLGHHDETRSDEVLGYELMTECFLRFPESQQDRVMNGDLRLVVSGKQTTDNGLYGIVISTDHKQSTLKGHSVNVTLVCTDSRDYDSDDVRNHQVASSDDDVKDYVHQLGGSVQSPRPVSF